MLGISDWLPYLNFIIPFMIMALYQLYGRNNSLNEKVTALEKELALNDERDKRTALSVETVLESFKTLQGHIDILAKKIEDLALELAKAEGYKQGQGS